jgi:hypothetical protein
LKREYVFLPSRLAQLRHYWRRSLKVRRNGSEQASALAISAAPTSTRLCRFFAGSDLLTTQSEILILFSFSESAMDTGGPSPKRLLSGSTPRFGIACKEQKEIGSGHLPLPLF